MPPVGLRLLTDDAVCIVARVVARGVSVAGANAEEAAVIDRFVVPGIVVGLRVGLGEVAAAVSVTLVRWRLTRRFALCLSGVALDRVLLGAAGQIAEDALGFICYRIVRNRRCAFGVLLVHPGPLSVARQPCTTL